MTIVLHDSGTTGKLTWAKEAVASCGVERVFLSPFETPPKTLPRRPSASECVSELGKIGAEVLLDPTTHVLQPSSNRTDIYDQWSLWSKKRELDSAPALLEHVRRTVDVQQSLNVRPFLPTLAIEFPRSPKEALAIEMIETGLRIASSAVVAIAGTPAFWSGGADLDHFVGQIAFLRPAETVLSVVHANPTYPVQLGPLSVEGLCRSTQALALRSRVTIAHGDFAALPLVAVGATSVGSGWNLAQRRCSYDLSMRVDEIRRSSDRVTYEGLLSALKKKEAQKMAQRNAPLSATLLPGQVPVGKVSLWQAHLSTLARLVGQIRQPSSLKQRVDQLRSLYLSAIQQYPHAVKAGGRLAAGKAEWIDPFLIGLNQYAQIEGV